MKRREILQTLGAVMGSTAVAGTLSHAAQGSSQDNNASALRAGDAAQLPPINLFDFEEIARRRLPQMYYDFVAGGAGDELTLRRNRASYDAIRLKPRVLRDVSQLDTKLELFGQQMDFPI